MRKSSFPAGVDPGESATGGDDARVAACRFPTTLHFSLDMPGGGSVCFFANFFSAEKSDDTHDGTHLPF
jgi:hypothetical protein